MGRIFLERALQHEIDKIEKIEYDDLAKLLDRDALALFRANALNPEHPVMRSTVQNPDIYFQVREANNRFYNVLPDIVEDYMSKVQDEMKNAVDAGYWTLYRYNPDNEKPLTVDSKAPSVDYEKFLDGEVRYSSLKRTFPDNAKKFFAEGSEKSREKYEKYKRMEESQ